MLHALEHLLGDQDGVVSRRQAEAAGVPPHVIERLTRQRLLTSLHPGVYVDHTGRPTYRQRTWGGVLLYPGAAASGSTAQWLTDGAGPSPSAVHLVVPRGRRLTPPAGVDVTRSDALHAEVQWQARPPRVRYEAAVLQLAAEAQDDLDAVAVLTGALGSRRTTAERLAAALGRRERIARRAWLEAVLDDLRLGTHSVLEHGYLRRVERAHRLPRARWQQREQVAGRTVYRDATLQLPKGVLVIELDGRAHHDSSLQRARDYERDLDVVAGGRLAVRLSWAQVYGAQCATADRIARIAQQLGWSGTLRRCGPRCRA